MYKKIILHFIILLTAVIINSADNSSCRDSDFMQLHITRNVLDFGEIEPEHGELIQNNAVTLKVYSDVNWMLMIYSDDDLVSDQGMIIPLNQLGIRTFNSSFRYLETGQSVIIASGLPTSTEGEEIILDFKLILGQYNTAGRYNTRLSLELISAF